MPRGKKPSLRIDEICKTIIAERGLKKGLALKNKLFLLAARIEAQERYLDEEYEQNKGEG